MLRTIQSYMFLFAMFSVAQGQMFAWADAGRQEAPDTCNPGHVEKKEWMSRMEERRIKSVGVDARFAWNNGVEDISITNLRYYSASVTLTSGEESRLMDARPDSDAFSKALSAAAVQVITDQLRNQLPAELAKRRLTRARGDIVVILFEDPCLPVKSHLADNLVDPDVSPLMRAASGHSLSQFYTLLQAGADVNAHDQMGSTPLMAASFAGNVEMVEALLAHRARVNDKNIDGRTALHYAAECPDTSDVIPVLLKAGADINAKLGSTARHLGGASPLIVAAAMGNVPAVKLLLDAGADQNVLTWDRMTALDVARHPPILARPGHAEVIRLLEQASHEAANQKRE